MSDKMQGRLLSPEEAEQVKKELGIPPKQVLVVRKDLNMRKGKIAAQCAHASMKILLDKMVKDVVPGFENTYALVLNDVEVGGPLDMWLEDKFTKICVSVNSEAELDAIYEKALAAGVLCSIIVDSGKTEFHGVPTKTVVAIGPDWSYNVDAITGGLPLL